MSCKYIAAIIRTFTSIGEWACLACSLKTGVLWYSRFFFTVTSNYKLAKFLGELVERLKKTA